MTYGMVYHMRSVIRNGEKDFFSEFELTPKFKPMPKLWLRVQNRVNFSDGLEVVDCSEGRDIERSDGILATILVESKVLYFLIWHDRFPVDVRALF